MQIADHFLTYERDLMMVSCMVLLQGEMVFAKNAAEIYGVDAGIKRMIDLYAPCTLSSALQDAGISGTVPACNNSVDTVFVLVAVSGTLEEGFPLRQNLDFKKSSPDEVLAVFLGKALIRGLKAHLDIKNPTSREFKNLPANNPINPAMIATGNPEDANIYSVYAVDRRQAVAALLNEPRFLSMTPDLVKVDIHAEETSPTVRKFILNQIDVDNNDTTKPKVTNKAEATLLTVVSTWNSCHFIASPVLYKKKDGTQVTDFPNSLAKFAGVTDQLRVENPGAYTTAIQATVRKVGKNTDNCNKLPQK